MSKFFINLDLESKERFDFAKLMRFDNEDNYDPLTSSFLLEINDLPEQGNYKVRTEDERPENISFYIFGDAQFWWILLVYNNILSYRDLASGQVLRFPSLEDIESLFFSLKSKEFAEGL